jgi:hypothetical protein
VTRSITITTKLTYDLETKLVRARFESRNERRSIDPRTEEKMAARLAEYFAEVLNDLK